MTSTVLAGRCTAPFPYAGGIGVAHPQWIALPAALTGGEVEGKKVLAGDGEDKSEASFDNQTVFEGLSSCFHSNVLTEESFKGVKDTVSEYCLLD